MMSEDIMSTKDSYQTFGALLLQNNSEKVFVFSAHFGTIFLPKENSALFKQDLKAIVFQNFLIWKQDNNKKRGVNWVGLNCLIKLTLNLNIRITFLNNMQRMK